MGGGGGPDLLPPPSGSGHGTGQCIHLFRYTENLFYRAHRLLYNTAYFLSHAQIFKLAKHSLLNSIRSDLDPNRFCKCKFREKERDWYMHILSGKSKSIDISTSREGGERERCVFFFNFVIFLSTYFKVSCISLQNILMD